MRVVGNWNSLPRETVNAPSLETPKIGVDRALSSLVVEDVLADCRVVGLDDHYHIPCDLNCSMILYNQQCIKSTSLK